MAGMFLQPLVVSTWRVLKILVFEKLVLQLSSPLACLLVRPIGVFILVRGSPLPTPANNYITNIFSWAMWEGK